MTLTHLIERCESGSGHMDDRIVEAVARPIVASRNLPEGCEISWPAFHRDARAAITAYQAEAFKEPTAWAEEYGKAGVVSVSLRRGAFHHVPLYRLPPAPKASP